MPPSEKSDKFYLIVGKIVVFIARWLFYIALFYIAFMMGSKQGTLKERAKQVEFPKIKIIFPGANQPSGSPPDESPSPGAYLIWAGSFDNYSHAEALLAELHSKRINGYISEEAGQYHVYVGEFHSEHRAQAVLQQVHQQGFDEATIITPATF
ncbi:MAG: SPOR domain-containing protein [candidate division KSB1 bacterium]|nr:SPOR domain-containing protein [candidate division KSB1 bacterium]